jgi:hypothetical protein
MHDSSMLIDLDSFARHMGTEELNKFLKELHWGVHARQVTSHFRQQHHAREAAGQHGTDALGECTTVIDASAFHFWGQREGYECWDDDTFLKEIRRDNPATRVRTAAQKTTIVIPGLDA